MFSSAATVGTEDLTPKKPDFCDACCGPKVKNWTDKHKLENTKAINTVRVREEARKLRGEIFKHSPCNFRSETTLSSISRSHATTCTNAATYNLPSLERRLKHKQYYKKRTDSKAIQTFDTPRSCDVSTNTKDWWSPIPEKREYRNIGRKTEIDMKEEIKKVIRMRRKMDKAIESNGKVVTFKSRTSIIPSLYFSFLLLV
ncbi:unnamed protein product [Diatraea saccharalis]|uniref:Uncharacterized protein n=1 Tax=Diatraea saccharalis TaxID=40085 RepID=A0A9N9REF0_9NEOP|nr:unnamed protein product [Diatraea saccharalis]